MFKKSGCRIQLLHQKYQKLLQKADKYLLPGVGSFDHGINSLKSASLKLCAERGIRENIEAYFGYLPGDATFDKFK